MSKSQTPAKRPARTLSRPAGKLRILRLFVLAMAGYLVFQLAQIQINIYKQRDALEALNAQCLNQQAENDNVERYLSMQDDTQLVEQIAREKLGFAYPDERVFIDAAGS